jgi:site-specific DNA-methyltransferase (adenine-specific)
MFCFCRWDTENEFYNALNKAGWIIQSQVIWDRGIHGLGNLRRQFAPMHDNALFCTARDYVFPGRRPKSVYRIDRLSADKLLHPTQKPSGLMQRMLIDTTAKDWAVLDPFMGSGTTGVACVKTGRNFIGIEIDETYFKIAERRIKEAQQQPTLRT